ncbi:hypothetical protein CGRA01v4_06146 [Colletotrichum graminicola]|nr:hypothetical protein CGRA01v4_06146 [Colletotrichum graminicola]
MQFTILLTAFYYSAVTIAASFAKCNNGLSFSDPETAACIKNGDLSTCVNGSCKVGSIIGHDRSCVCPPGFDVDCDGKCVY